MLAARVVAVYAGNMSATSLETLGTQIRTSVHALTSWEALGLTYDERLTQQIIAQCPEDLQRPPQEEGQRREARAVSQACRVAAWKLMCPLVERLFADEKYEDARANWQLFGVNYYETGDFFPPHRDLNNSGIMTIVIATVSGIRRLNVEGSTLTLEPRSIAILDGSANPLHSAYCEEGPSVSIVADIPELLY